MADLSKIKLNGKTYNIKDSTARTHISNTSNPHGVTKAQVGLGNVTNESKATMFTNAALTGTPTAPTASAGTNSTQIATTAFVKTAIDNIPDPMVFKGTIGKANGSGTVATLPTSNVTIGDTYKIIEENKSIAAKNSDTGVAVTAKVGDTIIATTTTPK